MCRLSAPESRCLSKIEKVRRARNKMRRIVATLWPAYTDTNSVKHRELLQENKRRWKCAMWAHTCWVEWVEWVEGGRWKNATWVQQLFGWKNNTHCMAIPQKRSDRAVSLP